MIVLMAVAGIVFVVQLAWVGSWARSVRISTLLQAVGVGFAVCAPVAVALEWLVTRGVVAVGHQPLYDVSNRATWTYDPVIEEVVKVAPLVVLALWWPRTHRQLGWTDHLLAGVGFGVGFHLWESAMRFSRIGGLSGIEDFHGGYLFMPGLTQVPGIWTSLTTWLPIPAMSSGYYGHGWGADASGTVYHAVWTGVAALGVVWAVRRRGAWRLLGLVPLVWAILSHMVFNAEVLNESFVSTLLAHVAAWVFRLLSGWLVVLLLALVAADRVALAWARHRCPGLLLAGEAASGLNPGQVLRAGFRAPPWSVLPVWKVVLRRRAALNALVCGVPLQSAARTAQAVVWLGQADRAGWQDVARRLRGVVRLRRLWSWRLVLTLVAAVPSVAYLFVGGFPSTGGLQDAMSGWVGTGLIVAGMLVGCVLVISQLPGLVRKLRRLRDPVAHEARIRPAGQLVMAVVSLVSAVLMLARLAAAGDPAGHVMPSIADGRLTLDVAELLLMCAVLVVLLLILADGLLLAGTAGPVFMFEMGEVVMAFLEGFAMPTTGLTYGLGASGPVGWTAAIGLVYTFFDPIDGGAVADEIGKAFQSGADTYWDTVGPPRPNPPLPPSDIPY